MRLTQFNPTIKRRFLHIYIIVIVVFMAFFFVMFGINRAQYLRQNLTQNEQLLQANLKIAENLVALAKRIQLAEFVDYAKLLEHIYRHDNAKIGEILSRGEIYDFIAVSDLEARFTIKSGKILGIDFRDIFYADAVGVKIAFDAETKTTYKVFAYPILRESSPIAYIVACLKMDFLSEFSNMHLVSQDGRLLNDSQNSPAPHFPLTYAQEWGKITAQQNGQIISTNGIFTFSYSESIPKIGEVKVIQTPYYLISLVPIDHENSPYFIHDLRGFLRFIDLRANIVYWVIGGVWIFCTAIIFAIFIESIITNSKLATFDSMTGTYNRHAGYARIQRFIREMGAQGLSHHLNEIIARLFFFRRAVRRMHFCVADIDELKKVNDTLGHKSGDELILNAVEVLRKLLWRGEIMIRLGGDEFLIVFLNRTERDIEVFWKSASIAFINKNNSGNLKFNIKVSHGSAEYCLGEAIDGCIVRADELMYQEKRRHKVSLFFT